MVKYKVRVNEENETIISFTNEEIIFDNRTIPWNQVRIENNRFHILRENHSFNCEIIKSDLAQKSFIIKVNGRMTEVKIKDRYDDLLHQLGMDKPPAHHVNAIKAPMPGMVLKILVSKGEAIQKGDSLLILEAMKMENIIRSPGAGIVKDILVKERNAIEKNQLLIELS